MDEIIRGGVIALVLTFVVITLYLFLSTPFDSIYSEVEDLNMTNSDTHVDNVAGLGRTIFDMIFVIAGATPWVWLIYLLQSREPEWRY